MSHIAIDADRCTGHGRCFSLSPDVFSSDDQGYAVLLVQDVEPGSDDADQAENAIMNCPEAAIRMTS